MVVDLAKTEQTSMGITLKEIQDAIPERLFKKSLGISFYYLFRDLILVSLLGLTINYIDFYLPNNTLLWFCCWGTYWVVQGIAMTGLWVLAHECGHQAFSDYKFVNDGVGLILHSCLLVPYHSWRISHGKHHKSTGHYYKDQVFVPPTRSEFERDDIFKNSDIPINSSIETIWNAFSIVKMLTFGWPMYLLINVTGQSYENPDDLKEPSKTLRKWVSHYNPYSPIFDHPSGKLAPSHHLLDVVVSDLGLLIFIGSLCLSVYRFQITWFQILIYYFIPYLFVNMWLVLITYLQHTDKSVPHYNDEEWTFLKGALSTVDRSYGSVIDELHHHIADTHVVHHLFSRMPHYHAQEATEYIKQVLGKHYNFDSTPIYKALWNSYST